MSRRRSSSLSQPEPERRPSGAAARQVPLLPSTPVAPGPDVASPAAGDHRSAVDVGASFFSAAELAQLALPGLPRRAEHITRRASDESWPHRKRQGRGGGREFALDGLPVPARNEILKRRVAAEAGRAIGLPAAPIVIAQDLNARQAETAAARQAVIDAYDRFKGTLPYDDAMKAFIVAFDNGSLALAPWVRERVKSVSKRNLERWRAARAAGRAHQLTDNRTTGAKSIFERAPELGEFVLGAHLKQPALSMDNLAALVAVRFSSGVAGDDGIVIGLPSAKAIGRFLAKWKGEARNAALVASVTDPDRYRSKFRFAIGNASARWTRPNQRWEIDASPADRMFVDGRSNIYAVVDVFSRRLLAMVSKTPRTTGALLLIARACQAWGVPEEISTDNGSDFTSRHFDLCLHQLGIRHHVVPPYSPQLKPFVERAIGTIQHKFMPLFDGYAGHNVAARSRIEQRRAFSERMGEDEKSLLGAGTFSGDVQDELLAWIANVYEQRPHAGLGGRTPLQAWHDGWEACAAEHPQRVVDAAALGLLLMPPATSGGTAAAGVGMRTVTNKGVAVDGIDYFHPRLIVGQRVHVRLDPADLGRVWIYADAGMRSFIGIAVNTALEGTDRAEAAQRAKALQAAWAKEGRANIRRLIRDADVHGVARRLIGEVPAATAPDADGDNVIHLTPALEEAARVLREGASTRRRQAIEPPSKDEQERLEKLAEKFEQQPATRESGAERYARWKELKIAADRGEQPPADIAAWFTNYPSTGEWRFHSKIDGEGGE